MCVCLSVSGYTFHFWTVHDYEFFILSSKGKKGIKRYQKQLAQIEYNENEEEDMHENCQAIYSEANFIIS